MSAAQVPRWRRYAVFPYWPALLILALANAVFIVAAARFPYFQGDVELARFIQSRAPLQVGLAQWITATAEMPWCFVLLGLATLASWLIGGGRAAALSVAAFFGLWIFGLWLSPIISQPRPSPQLIQVVGHPKGYSFPSIFGLLYVATFGYPTAVAATQSRGMLRLIVFIGAALILLLGAIARIDLGAHWPSDLWVAYLLGLFWILLLLPWATKQPGIS